MSTKTLGKSPCLLWMLLDWFRLFLLFKEMNFESDGRINWENVTMEGKSHFHLLFPFRFIMFCSILHNLS